MSDERFDMASKLANEIQIRAEDLSVAIYEARKYGYDTVVRVRGGFMNDENERGLRITGVQDIKATIAFDIGRAV